MEERGERRGVSEVVSKIETVLVTVVSSATLSDGAQRIGS
jgi:hypothetical protein